MAPGFDGFAHAKKKVLIAIEESTNAPECDMEGEEFPKRRYNEMRARVYGAFFRRLDVIGSFKKMNVIEQLEKEQAESLLEKRAVPEFAPGDTVRVNVKVVEGQRERIQAYEGVCIARGGVGLNESFTVRKISYGEGVERVFPVFSPMIDSIDVVRRGDVRRAKLYYLRGRRGKSARIAEKQDFTRKKGKDDTAVSDDKEAPAVEAEKANEE